MRHRSLPPLRLLTVFEAVVRAGGIQKAAGELNVTQPAVSQALRSLEDHVGGHLFDRRTRPATLTEAGRILEAAVREGLGRIADAVLHIRAMRAVEDGSVTVACSVGTATYWLMPRLADFYATHPNIAVNVMTTQGNPGPMSGVDLFIRFGEGEWTDGRVVKLFDEEVAPVGTPTLTAALAARGDLSEATLLHVRSDDRNWLDWSGYLAEAGMPPHRGQARYFTNYVQATQAALAGLGVMLGWQSNTGDLVREGRLARLAGTPTLRQHAFYLVVRERGRTGVLEQWLAAAG